MYLWCNSDTKLSSGKINEKGLWVNEKTPVSIRVVLGDEANTVNIIKFETIGGAEINSQTNDSAVAYSWSDGVQVPSAVNQKTAGVISYKNGITGDILEKVGWHITIPAAKYVQTVSFVGGVWQASSKIEVFSNGNGKEPVYSNDSFKADSTVLYKKYDIIIPTDTSIEIVGSLTNKTNGNGNITVGGIALSKNDYDKNIEYKKLLQNTIDEGEVWIKQLIDETYINQIKSAVDSARTTLQNEGCTNETAFLEYSSLKRAISIAESSLANGEKYVYFYDNGITSSFGWEGDKDAPIAWADGTYKLRDNENITVNFGVSDLPQDSIDWSNAEGYLPCFISKYSKDGMDYKVENFADKLTIGGKDYVIAYSRMTSTNNNDVAKVLPRVSKELVALNNSAKNETTVGAGKTVTRDYCIGADRFGGSYEYPSSDELVSKGGFDEHYNHMKEYWNNRLDMIINIESLPKEYAELINAYKAGYIYTLIISDGYELHVGENGYDRVFDHDVIGIISTLIELGQTEHFTEYATYILQNIQYPDAAWKFSWPFALYLQKTGDSEVIKKFWDKQGSIDGIKTNTHKIAEQRVEFKQILDSDGNTARIMKETNAIDSKGYWTIDNWAALFGLTTYSYLCDQMYNITGDVQYKNELEWAKKEYDSLLKSVEAVLADTMEKNNLNYIPMSMLTGNENTNRSDVCDGNWAAHYLFGRWDWDGYLFGANQNSWLQKMTDKTYDYIISQKSTKFDSPYNMGGYGSNNFSSAYNAGYFSAALSGEKWRDGGIEAYRWMIENSMSGLYGWWESIGYPTHSTLNHITSINGGGSCQHMWGQSVTTKVLIDSLLAEKSNGTIIAGRGLPLTWNASGEEIKISNYLCDGGKRIGFKMNSSDSKIVFELTGDTLDKNVSLELLALVDNIKSVSSDLTFDNVHGSVLIPAGVKNVTITLKNSVESSINDIEANKALSNSIDKAEKYDTSKYVFSSAEALSSAIKAGKTALANGTCTEKLRQINQF